MTSDDPLRLTVAELGADGVDTIAAHCNFCGKSWPALISIMPEKTSLLKIRALLRCPTCSGSDIDVEPEWPAAPPSH